MKLTTQSLLNMLKRKNKTTNIAFYPSEIATNNPAFNPAQKIPVDSRDTNTIAMEVKIVPKHLKALDGLHRANNSVVIYRIFNKTPQELSGILDAIGKKMGVKIKSSTEDAIIGITSDTKLSKLHGNTKKVDEFQKRGDLDFNKSTLNFCTIVLRQILENAGLSEELLLQIFRDSRFASAALEKDPEGFSKIIGERVISSLKIIDEKLKESSTPQNIALSNSISKFLTNQQNLFLGSVDNPKKASQSRSAFLDLASQGLEGIRQEQFVGRLNDAEIFSTTNSRTDGSFPFCVTKLFLSITGDNERTPPFDDKYLDGIWTKCQSKILTEKEVEEAMEAFNKMTEYCLQKGIIKEGDIPIVGADSDVEFKDNAFYNLVGKLNNSAENQAIHFDVQFFTEKQYDLFISKDKAGLINYKDGDPTNPLLYMKVPRVDNPNEFDVYVYDKDHGKYDLVNPETVNSLNLEHVTVLNYDRFSIDDGKIIKSSILITPDYDELAKANQTIYPIENNNPVELVGLLRRLRIANLPGYVDNAENEKEYTAFRELLLKFERGEKLDDKEKGFLVDKIVEIENLKMVELKKEEYYRKGLGIINENGIAYLGAAGPDTDYNVIHGEERNNRYYTEGFPDGNYLVILPDGTKKIVHNEKEICDLFNEQCANGYSLTPNPKWFWQEEGRVLSVPKNRFDYQPIEDGLKKLYGIAMNMDGCEIIKEEHMADGQLPYLRYTEGSSEKTKKAVELYNRQKAIYELRLEIQRERTIPEVVYGNVADEHKSPVDAARFEKFDKEDLDSLKHETTKKLEEQRLVRLTEQERPEIIDRFKSLQGCEFLQGDALKAKGLEGWYSELNTLFLVQYDVQSLVAEQDSSLKKQESFAVLSKGVQNKGVQGKENSKGVQGKEKPKNNYVKRRIEKFMKLPFAKKSLTATTQSLTVTKNRY